MITASKPRPDHTDAELIGNLQYFSWYECCTDTNKDPRKGPDRMSNPANNESQAGLLTQAPQGGPGVPQDTLAPPRRTPWPPPYRESAIGNAPALVAGTFGSTACKTYRCSLSYHAPAGRRRAATAAMRLERFGLSLVHPFFRTKFDCH
jgi:hypothetical protein